MCDCKVIRRQVCRLGVRIGKRSERVADDLGIAVVFHHDEENVVQGRNALGHSSLLREHGSRKSQKQAYSKGLLSHSFSSNSFLNFGNLRLFCFPPAPPHHKSRQTEVLPGGRWT